MKVFDPEQKSPALYAYRNAEIVALLSNDAITFSEIGSRFGISRERVRQLAEKFGNTSGAIRIARRRQKRRMEQLLASKKIKQASERVAEQHLSFEPISGSLAKIGGHLCYLSLACHYDIGTRTYFRLRPSDTALETEAEWVLYLSEAGTLILPRKVWPSGQTRIVLGREKLNPGAYSNRHDYAEYLNAWHLLQAKREGHNV